MAQLPAQLPFLLNSDPGVSEVTAPGIIVPFEDRTSTVEFEER